MNYRHAYHAGNFADVLKHAVLAMVLDYMKRKEAPFRVVDTHAGAGRYALTGVEAGKTGEWQGGIGRLLGANAAPLPQAVARLLQPYLDAVRAENAGAALDVYPGSPLIALRLMRAQDALIANELHPEDLAHLKVAIGADRRAKATGLDAWVALKALLPPKERRGVVLIDPPFEEGRELERMAEGLAQGVQRFATGVYLAWYPIKDPNSVARFLAGLAELDGPTLMRVEVMIQRVTDPERLNGCGLIVANPPYTLEADLAAVLPELSRRLAAVGSGASYRMDWIGPAPAGTGRAAFEPKRRTRPRERSKR
jgi:23S rRNA (adenine2030-N6)-methyltransferase